MPRGVAADFEVRLARTEADLRAAQRLRYEVFVAELGADGAMVDHDAGLERDRFDPLFDHLLLHDRAQDRLAGVYRVMRDDMAARAGGFYSASEYDLTPLLNSGRRLLELGRSCLAPSYRGGAALHHLWGALAEYVAEHQIELLFGVASFKGTDPSALAAPLSLLHHRHLAPPELRVQVREGLGQRMDLIAEDKLDRRAAMAAVPGLIKAYLRMGGHVGEGAFVDHAFNTTDVCLILDRRQMDARRARIYGGGLT